MRVQVYWNITKKTWSVKDKALGRVVLHLPSMVLEGCTFKVQKGGRARVLREKQKNIHAFVEGEMDCMGTMAEGLRNIFPTATKESVTYDPYKHETFVRRRDGAPVHTAEHVILTSKDGKPEVLVC